MQLLSTDNCIVFGKKHYGEQILDVMHSDPQYCLWLKTQDFINRDSKLVDFLKDFTYTITDVFMPWGKYKNETIEEISKKDPDYINWLKNNDFVKKSTKLYSEVCKF